MKDRTILILGGGALALVGVGGYVVYKAVEKAKKDTADAACTTASAPRNLLNGLSTAVLGKKLFGTSCTDKRDANTYTGVPTCPSGQYWNGNQGKCVPNETVVRPAGDSNTVVTPGYLSGNKTAPLSADANPWGQDIIITRPDGSQTEVHPVTAPTGYKVVYSVDGSKCPDGSVPKTDPANGMKYCIVPGSYSAIMNPALNPGLPGNPGNITPSTGGAPATTTASGSGNNIFGFKLPGVNSTSTGEVW